MTTILLKTTTQEDTDALWAQVNSNMGMVWSLGTKAYDDSCWFGQKPCPERFPNALNGVTAEYTEVEGLQEGWVEQEVWS